MSDASAIEATVRGSVGIFDTPGAGSGSSGQLRAPDYPRVNLIERVRTLCLVLPETFELETWDHPTFRVGSGRGKIFCTAAGDGTSITLKADPVEREALLAQGDPFFLPAYVGDKGWVGMRLDLRRTDWEEVAELIATGYCLIAPKRLARTVTSPPSLDGRLPARGPRVPQEASHREDPQEHDRGRLGDP
jgi:predicted DNA-binding protein (MmcQ/YjbR family)